MKSVAKKTKQMPDNQLFIVTEDYGTITEQATMQGVRTIPYFNQELLQRDVSAPPKTNVMTRIHFQPWSQ